MKHDLFSDAMSAINNAENVGKESCAVPKSNFIEKVLDVIKSCGYISGFSVADESIEVRLLGKINKIKSIKPRFSVKKGEFDRWEIHYLPARNMGILILSTSQGIMSQADAEKKGVGGKLVAYVY